MGKIFSFRYALLLSILLFSISSYGLAKEHIHAYKEHDTSSLQAEQYLDGFNVGPITPEYDLPNKSIYSVRNSSFILDPSLIQNDKTLKLSDTWITLGESSDSVLIKLGSPNRIAETEMDFDYYVYNNDYSKLLFVAIKDNKVVGYYTDSLDFNYLDITYGSSLDKVNGSLDSDLAMDYVLTYTTKDYTLHIFMDEIGRGTVTGVSLLTTDVKEIGYTDKSMGDIELLVYDLTNSIRKRNGISILSWSSTAAIAAARHSKDMAENSYFDHYNLYNNSPGDRLREEGIYYQFIGENIIAGYENAIISSHAWFNSPDHRDNMLNNNYHGLGVGYTYLEDSVFKNYITQIFYR